MQVLLIGIILTLLDIAISLYLLNRNPDAAAALTGAEPWTMRPM